jgi:hypothetical protein
MLGELNDHFAPTVLEGCTAHNYDVAIVPVDVPVDTTVMVGNTPCVSEYKFAGTHGPYGALNSSCLVLKLHEVDAREVGVGPGD